MARFTRRRIERLERAGELAAGCRCHNNGRVVHANAPYAELPGVPVWERLDTLARDPAPVCRKCGGLRPTIVIRWVDEWPPEAKP
jgi:hypothetical protein